MICLAQRFVAGKVLIIDGTFNTNKLRLLLLIGVGITNSSISFPVALSYCPGETAESYDFFFCSLRKEIFADSIKPAVIMED